MPIQTCSQTIRVAAVLLTILLSRATAQNVELTIAVTGPWDYVQDPDNPNRVVIVAPQADHHLAPAINSAGTFSPLSLGRYSLDIANRAATCATTAPQLSEAATVFHLPTPPSIQKVRAVIKNPSSRYAISLPKPCYFSSKATSYSIISPTAITTAAAQAQGKAYTTLMVLHYFVTTRAAAALTSTPDVGSTSTSPLQFDHDNIGIGIETDQTEGSNDECDSTSADSFAREIELFTTQKFHVWFPDFDMQTGTQAGHYQDQCKDPVMVAALRFDMPVAAEVRNKIKYVEAYFENPTSQDKQSAQQALDEIKTKINGFQSNKYRKGPLNKPTLAETNQELNAARDQLAGKQATGFDGRHLSAATAFTAFFTPGSGDCHGAQTSIDGVL